MDQIAQGRAAAAAWSGLLIAAALLLALAGCTRTHVRDFAVDPQDRAYSARALYDDFRKYLRSRGLRTIIETNNLLEVELEQGDALRVRLTPEPRVELTLVRATRGSDFTDAEIRRFQETFSTRMRELTGEPITIRLVDTRVSPIIQLGPQRAQ